MFDFHCQHLLRLPHLKRTVTGVVGINPTDPENPALQKQQKYGTYDEKRGAPAAGLGSVGRAAFVVDYNGDGVVLVQQRRRFWFRSADRRWDGHI